MLQLTFVSGCPDWSCDHPAGICTFTPPPNFHGSYNISYGVTDNHGGVDSGIVRITVTPVNDDPNAVNDSATTDEDVAKVVNVLGNDTDVEGNSLTVTTASPAAAHGTVACTSAGECTYTPNSNYHGSDSFTYGVSDGNGGTDTATVSVTVTPVNDAPVADDDSLTTTAGTAKGENVLDRRHRHRRRPAHRHDGLSTAAHGTARSPAPTPASAPTRPTRAMSAPTRSSTRSRTGTAARTRRP